jgi:hypothetical protein
MHPLCAVPFLYQRITENHAEALEEYQKEIIKKSYKQISEVCQPHEKNIGFLFRLGFAEPASGLSSRLRPKIKFEN